MTASLPASFLTKKARILSLLSVDPAQYDDLSPKGSIDVGIRELIDEINGLEGCVTTSSCAGRISVFLEGKRSGNVEVENEDVNVIESSTKEAEEGDAGNGDVGTERAIAATTAGVGGKGGGGRWLFVSHDPVEVESYEGSWAEILGMKSESDSSAQGGLESGIKKDTRFIHFKFEPMILHILTSSLQQAQTVLAAALQAGFRESGALNLTPPSSSSSSSEPATPMVGIRSMGLSLESVIGYEADGSELCMVPAWQLRNLVQISNQRFVENAKRIARFRSLLKEMSERAQQGEGERRVGDGGVWEDGKARRERKRAEGLRRAEELRAATAAATMALVGNEDAEGSVAENT